MDREKIRKLEQMIPFLERARKAAEHPEKVDITRLHDEYSTLACGLFGKGDIAIPTEVNRCFTFYFLCCAYKPNDEKYSEALAEGHKRLEELKETIKEPIEINEVVLNIYEEIEDKAKKTFS